MHAQHVTADTISQIVASVWSQVLGLTISSGSRFPLDADTPILSVTVHIAGAWNGAILLWPSDQFAVRAASILFDVPQTAVTQADVQDGMAELGNMVAGHLKSILPGPSALSLPTVTRGVQHEVFVRRTRVIAEQTVLCDGAPIKVLVLEAANDDRLEPLESSAVIGSNADWWGMPAS